MLKPLEKVMIHSKAAEAIENYIRDNNFQNGDKLPSERELASMLSIGRNSLREAIRTLEAMDLVEVLNGKGIFVKDINTDKSINVKVISAKVNFLELLDVRKVLENRAIELAVKNANEEDMEVIESALIELEKECEKGYDCSEVDKQFHHAIYNASHNKTLYSIIKPLAASFDDLWIHFGEKEKTVYIETLPLHRLLFQAIKKRSLKEASKIFNQMIKIDEKTVMEYIKKDS